VNSSFRRASLVALVLLAACGRPDAGEGARELQVFTWGGYLDREIVAEFEREAGVRVVESNYSSNEEMQGKLQLGASGYDLVCPSDYAVVQLVRDGLLLPIDATKLPHLGNLGERFRAPAYDPSHAHSVPFQWGVTGIGWVEGAAQPPRSWKEFFDAAKNGRHGKVSLLDDRREVLGAALLALGHSPNSRDAAEIRAAAALVASARPHVAKFDSDDPATSLVAGEIGLAQGWSGMFAVGRRDDPRVSFLVPSEGTFTYVDNWAIPKGARQVELAHAFIDFCLRPQVAARLVTSKLYASCNEAAKAHLAPEVLSGITYESGAGVKLHWVEDVGPAGDVYTAAWDELRAE
jgi:spermidine/putrescine transport system substrate-binding protein